MKRARQWKHALKAASSTCCAIIFLTGTAHADTFTNVKAGQTLAQLSHRFHVSVDDLRKANRLQNGDDEALPAMMLRIPDAEQQSYVRTEASALRESPDPQIRQVPQAQGIMTKTGTYTVQRGDGWMAIARACAQRGYHLTADEIQQQNPNVTTLRPGMVLQISATQRYGEPVDQNFSLISANTQEIQAQLTDTVVGSRQVVNQTPSHLSSRSSSGATRQLALSMSESSNTATNSSATTTSRSHANVAKVVNPGANIRRNPSATGTILFACPVGTQLVVTGQESYWYSVMMSDRSTGWIPAKYVEMQQRRVNTSSNEIITGAQAAANFKSAPAYKSNGNWVSSNPLLREAFDWLGTPYRYGGTSRKGIDCSAFVQHTFSTTGIKLPRTAAQQATVGTPISQANLQVGDRLYFSSSRKYIDHTGIYIGDGQFIHASGSRKGVIVSKLSEPFYQRIYKGARR